MFFLSTSIQLTFEYLQANENYVIVFCFLIIQLEANLIFFLTRAGLLYGTAIKSPNQEAAFGNRGPLEALN